MCADLHVCVVVAGGRKNLKWGCLARRQGDGYTDRSRLTAVFTDGGNGLIGHAFVKPLLCDLPVIRGFCLQKEVTLHGSSTPTACLNLDPNLPAPHPSVCLQRTSRQIKHRYHLLLNVNHRSALVGLFVKGLLFLHDQPKQMEWDQP